MQKHNLCDKLPLLTTIYQPLGMDLRESKMTRRITRILQVDLTSKTDLII